MKRYIGIDVHKQTSSLVALDARKKVIRDLVVETSGETLIATLQGIAGEKYVCIEEGSMSEWLTEVLSPHASELVVVIPEKSKGAKNDRSDARGLAEAYRNDALPRTVFKASSRLAGVRHAVQTLRCATQDVVRCKTRLRMLCNSRGVTTAGKELFVVGEREKWFALLPAPVRAQAEILSMELDALLPVHAAAVQLLEGEAEKLPEVKLLATAPGIGTQRAAEIVAATISPHRFRKPKHYISYCGLGIRTHSSADYEQRAGTMKRRNNTLTRGLKQGNTTLKAAFRGAANTIVARMPKHPLHQKYRLLVANGTRDSSARLTVARKLATATLVMWKNQEPYNPELIAI